MRLPVVLSLVMIAVVASPANADPIEPHDVICHTANGPRDCGTMRITQFDNRRENTEESPNRWLGGAEIRAFFSSELALDYHYLQAVVTDEADDLRWIHDTSVKLPVEYVDAAPGGFKAQANADAGYNVERSFDYRPWYDQGDFPSFYDKAMSFMLPAKDQPDKRLSVYFETWLVCVIDELFTDNDQAKDDLYKVAPLLGWIWGYVIQYRDVGIIGTDELEDFTFVETALNWIEVPSPQWRDALNARFGANGQDFFRIELGDCEECAVPEPPLQLLMLGGVVALIVNRLRPGR